MLYLLSLFDGLRHGQEHAVEQDSSHDHIVEQLIGTEVDAGPAHRRPGRPPEERAGGGEAVDVVLAEALGDDAECLEGVTTD